MSKFEFYLKMSKYVKFLFLSKTKYLCNFLSLKFIFNFFCYIFIYYCFFKGVNFIGDEHSSISSQFSLYTRFPNLWFHHFQNSITLDISMILTSSFLQCEKLGVAYNRYIYIHVTMVAFHVSSLKL